MAKFKVGDTVIRTTHENGELKIGDTGVVEKLSDTGVIIEGEYHGSDYLELVKEKKVKKAKENYIVVNSDTDRLEVGRLSTKAEAIETCTDSDYIIDISKAPHYNKVTTSRMVLQKTETKKKKKKGAK